MWLSPHRAMRQGLRYGHRGHRVHRCEVGNGEGAGRHRRCHPARAGAAVALVGGGGRAVGRGGTGTPAGGVGQAGVFPAPRRALVQQGADQQRAQPGARCVRVKPNGACGEAQGVQLDGAGRSRLRMAGCVGRLARRAVVSGTVGVAVRWARHRAGLAAVGSASGGADTTGSAGMAETAGLVGTDTLATSEQHPTGTARRQWWRWPVQLGFMAS